jgi:hypothetical protein
MRNVPDPIQRHDDKGPSAHVQRATSQRLVAGLLAATLTLTACGGAFDADPDTPSPMASAATDGEGIGPIIETKMLDEDTNAVFDKEDDSTSPGRALKASSCKHSQKVTLRNLSREQVSAVRTHWREYDPSTGGLRSVTLHPAHPAHDAANVIRDTHRTHYSEGVGHVTASIKYDTASGRNASFTVTTLSADVSTSKCRTIRRNLQQIEAGTVSADNVAHGLETRQIGALLGAAGAALLAGVTAAAFTTGFTTVVALSGIAVVFSLVSAGLVVGLQERHMRNYGPLQAAGIASGGIVALAIARQPDNLRYIKSKYTNAAAIAVSCCTMTQRLFANRDVGELRNDLHAIHMTSLAAVERAVGQVNPQP